jgi:DnaJ-class molecular chaperone
MKKNNGIPKKTFGKVNFMSETYHERDEDWMVTCPECHGTGAIGTEDSRKRCPKCGGSGRIKT